MTAFNPGFDNYRTNPYPGSGGRPKTPQEGSQEVTGPLDAIPGVGSKGVPGTKVGVDNSGDPTVLNHHGKTMFPGYEFGCPATDNGTPKHHGLDIAAKEGTPIKAWYDGEVQYSYASRPFSNYGQVVAIYYPAIDATIEAGHLARGSTPQSKQVKKEDEIGRLGGPEALPYSDTSHVHYRAYPGKQANPPANGPCSDTDPRPLYDGKRTGGAVDSAGDAIGSIADSFANLPRFLSQGIVSGVVGVFKWLFAKLILVPYDWLSGFAWNLAKNLWEGFTDTQNRPLFGPYNRQRIYFVAFCVLTYQLLWGRNEEGTPRLTEAIEQTGDGVNRTFGETTASRNRSPQTINFEAEYQGETRAKIDHGKTVTTKANVKKR